VEKAFVKTGPAEIKRLEQLIIELEDLVTMPEGFILPGATPASGALDLARAITRRAERRCLTLERLGGVHNPDVRRWLNRLSLLLFVVARYEENLTGSRAKAAKTSRRSSV
jgi:cob(I)alamin adenosyltransferase